MANILCFDFDDTIVLDNTFDQLITEFVPAAQLEAHYRDRSETLSVEQRNAAAFALIDPSVTRASIAEHMRKVARVREGLMELTDWAHWNEWLTVVVSLGLDVYVDPVLDDLGLDRVARHTGRARNTYRWQVRYHSPRGIEIEDGFKLSFAAAFRDSGDFVVYIGDGASDIAPARLAPAVFARSTLLEALTDQHPRVHPFESFHDITKVLERDTPGWLAEHRARQGAG